MYKSLHPLTLATRYAVMPALGHVDSSATSDTSPQRRELPAAPLLLRCTPLRRWRDGSRRLLPPADRPVDSRAWRRTAAAVARPDELGGLRSERLTGDRDRLWPRCCCRPFIVAPARPLRGRWWRCRPRDSRPVLLLLPMVLGPPPPRAPPCADGTGDLRRWREDHDVEPSDGRPLLRDDDEEVPGKPWPWREVADEVFGRLPSIGGEARSALRMLPVELKPWLSGVMRSDDDTDTSPAPSAAVVVVVCEPPGGGLLSCGTALAMRRATS